MQHPDPIQMLRNRQAPHNLSTEEFRALGRQVVDQIADFFASPPGRPVAPGDAPAQVRALLGDRPLPAAGAQMTRTQRVSMAVLPRKWADDMRAESQACPERSRRAWQMQEEAR